MARRYQKMQALLPEIKQMLEEGKSQREVAEILGVSVKTVDNHLAAAIRDVLEALQKQDIDSGSRMRLISWLL